MPGPHLSVIVPMLNEERAIAATLGALRRGAPGAEVIVVDGGSSDRGVAIARPLCDRLVDAPRGRARQMNAGAALATGDALAFVHADTLVPRDFALVIDTALTDARVVGGRFDLAFDDRRLAYRIVAASINLRSRLTRAGTGDQALFVRRDIFTRMDGFPAIDLCEDVDFARRLRRRGKIACPRARVITSARRWRDGGLVRTIMRMWLIKTLFLIGVPPARLKRAYPDRR
ncbi:MAG: TIGR04283 family arsenosugar biosynthesis glycosyltransferase [Candidatus Binataceae bacterium]|nr:TIGR04283 family arsenosugar biosynthesis glycosyltransferase [Candidatus Binataceae bacterium]